MLLKYVYSRCRTFKYRNLKPLDNILVISQNVNDILLLIILVSI